MIAEKELSAAVPSQIQSLMVCKPNLTVSFVGADGQERKLQSVFEGDLEEFDSEFDEVDDIVLHTPAGEYAGYMSKVDEYLKKQRDFGVKSVTVSNES